MTYQHRLYTLRILVMFPPYIFVWCTTDEMYEIMSYLPEDLMYHCPRCSKVRPAPWMRTIQQEMEAGIQLVIDALVENKKSRALDPVKDKVSSLLWFQLFI